MSNENGAGFDFKPADPVLVRNFKNETWELNFFGRRFNDTAWAVCCDGKRYAQCVPLEGNEGMLGTSTRIDFAYLTEQKKIKESSSGLKEGYLYAFQGGNYGTWEMGFFSRMNKNLYMYSRDEEQKDGIRLADHCDSIFKIFFVPCCRPCKAATVEDVFIAPSMLSLGGFYAVKFKNSENWSIGKFVGLDHSLNAFFDVYGKVLKTDMYDYLINRFKVEPK